MASGLDHATDGVASHLCNVVFVGQLPEEVGVSLEPLLYQCRDADMENRRRRILWAFTSPCQCHLKPQLQRIMDHLNLSAQVNEPASPVLWNLLESAGSYRRYQDGRLLI